MGMAIAGRWLAGRYNRDELTLFDFDVYALAGDGCMMEGVSAEAASLAGHLGLGLGALLDALGRLVFYVWIRLGQRLWAIRLVALPPGRPLVGSIPHSAP